MKNIPCIVYTISLLVFIALATGCARQHTVQAHGNELTLSYENSDAHEVFFAYSADNFQYMAANREPGGSWQVTIPLHKEFTYFYIVDGAVTLPECPDTVLDDFGSKNCFYQYGM